MFRYLLIIGIVLLMTGCGPKNTIQTETITLEEVMKSLVGGFASLQEAIKEQREKSDYKPYGLAPVEAEVKFHLGVSNEKGETKKLGASIPILKELNVEGYTATSKISDTRTNTFTIKFKRICDPYKLESSDLPPCPSNNERHLPPITN